MAPGPALQSATCEFAQEDRRPHSAMSAFKDMDRDWKFQSLPGLHAPKRSRPAASPSANSSCANSQVWRMDARHLKQTDDGWSPEQDDAQEQNDVFDEFDLGPPPAVGPMLMRQNAMDTTVQAEDYSARSRKVASKISSSPSPAVRLVAAQNAPRALPGRFLLRNSVSTPC